MPSVAAQPGEMGRPNKRIKTDDGQDYSRSACFVDGLLDSSSAAGYTEAYAQSTPYRHSLIPHLFQDSLVRKVRDEIKQNLVFTEKETDIYKVRQTGDLANLDGLEGDELSKLANLSKLRDALYSEAFRSFLRTVTGVGPLSGKKIDMSINNYTQGCHLLNHDDVIGTRSVSYILYLPDPDEPWLPEYGGALELYPVKTKGIPVDEPSLTLPPSWNQFIMFAVQPGHSFHSVEEVVAKDKERLSISGWFHVAQEGEEGHSKDANRMEREEEEKAKSTLEQLLSNEEAEFDAYEQEMSQAEELSEDDLKVLRPILNEQYLNLKTLVQVNDRFCKDSHILLSDILRRDVAQRLHDLLAQQDKDDGIVDSRMTPHGTGVGAGWQVQGPPHRHRYLTLVKPSSSSTLGHKGERQKEDATLNVLLHDIQSCLASPAFRKWLAIVTSLVPLRRTTETRRFRPGLDYTLATSNPQTLIQVNLCMTLPSDLWEEGEVGGYSCFMAPHEEEEDAAIYRTAPSRRPGPSNGQQEEDEEEEEEEDGGVLLTSQATWNTMTIVMREPGILSFTKYVAVRAGASRWDCEAQYQVQPVTHEDDDDDDDDDEKE